MFFYWKRPPEGVQMIAHLYHPEKEHLRWTMPIKNHPFLEGHYVPDDSYYKITLHPDGTSSAADYPLWVMDGEYINCSKCEEE